MQYIHKNHLPCDSHKYNATLDKINNAIIPNISANLFLIYVDLNAAPVLIEEAQLHKVNLTE